MAMYGYAGSSATATKVTPRPAAEHHQPIRRGDSVCLVAKTAGLSRRGAEAQ